MDEVPKESAQEDEVPSADKMSDLIIIVVFHVYFCTLYINEIVVLLDITCLTPLISI